MMIPIPMDDDPVGHHAGLPGHLQGTFDPIVCFAGRTFVNVGVSFLS